MAKGRNKQPPQEPKQPAARKRAPAAVHYGNHVSPIYSCLFCDGEIEAGSGIASCKGCALAIKRKELTG